jgi:amino acid transporter
MGNTHHEKGDRSLVAAERLTGTVVHVPLWKAVVLGFVYSSPGFQLALVPAYVVSLTGRSATLAMIFALLVMYPIAVAIVAFARRFVATGSLLSYAHQAFGNGGRALAGASLLAGYFVMTAAATVATQVFAASGLSALGLPQTDSWVGQILSTVLILGCACALACRGIDASARVSAVLGFICVPPILFVILAALRRHGLDLSGQFDRNGFSVQGLLTGMGAALASFVGFESVSSLAAETPNPRRNVPRLLYWVLTGQGAIGIVSCFLQAPPLIEQHSKLEAGFSPLSILADIGRVPYMQLPLDLLMVASGFVTVVAIVNFAGRVVATAAQDGLMPRWLALFNTNRQSPQRAVILLCGVATILLLVPSLLAGLSPLTIGSYYASAVVYFWLLPYFLVCLGAVRVELLERSRRPLVVLASMLGALSVFLLTFRELFEPEKGFLKWLPMIALSLIAMLGFTFYFRTRSAIVSHDRRE